MEQATTFCIIRHGETDWNAIGKLQGREDISLNNNGLRQAEDLANFFYTSNFDCIVSSPLQRAFQTAQIISKKISVPLYIEPLLVERCWGDASGLTFEERKRNFPDGIIPNQEEFEHMQARAMSAIYSIHSRWMNKRIIVVSHGALINSILHFVSHGEFGSFTTRLANACISLLQFNSDNWNVLYYNKSYKELQEQG